jgi:hypothetical protein
MIGINKSTLVGMSDTSTATTIAPGRIVRIHSLQSAGGKLLNGRRAAILRFDEPSQRFEIKLELDTDPDEPNITKAIKESNLRLELRLPLPDETAGNVVA